MAQLQLVLTINIADKDSLEWNDDSEFVDANDALDFLSREAEYQIGRMPEGYLIKSEIVEN